MNESNDNEQFVTCSCCQSIIPLSAALAPEGLDYVYYFCGPKCFDKWRSDQSNA